jgi:hypothetical protein
MHDGCANFKNASVVFPSSPYPRRAADLIPAKTNGVGIVGVGYVCIDSAYASTPSVIFGTNAHAMYVSAYASRTAYSAARASVNVPTQSNGFTRTIKG